MNIKEFQKNASRTINKNLTLEELVGNMAMGIAGESGEAVDIIKKWLYQGHFLNTEKLAEELGDVMWYIVNLCSALNIDVEEVLTQNQEKLLERYPNGFSAKDSVERG